jgi:hypothetical protein
MSLLNLNFLEQPIDLKELNPIEAILHEYGQEISQFARGYFNYVVSAASFNDSEVREASLYIIVPEIGYDYKIITLRYVDIENVSAVYFTLKTEQTEVSRINIENNWENVYSRISELLSTQLANRTFKFLVDQVDLKRETNSEQ